MIYQAIYLSFVTISHLAAFTYFSTVLHFIKKPVVWYVLQIKWLVSIWNAILGRNELSATLGHCQGDSFILKCFWLLCCIILNPNVTENLITISQGLPKCSVGFTFGCRNVAKINFLLYILYWCYTKFFYNIYISYLCYMFYYVFII